MNFKVHKTAIIDSDAEIGANTNIWHWSHISSGAKIGSNVIIGQNVFIDKNVSVGNNCKIQNNVSIYKNVRLDESVFCGPSVVFTNVKNPRAFIDRKTEFKDTIVEKGSSLGANCTIVCGITIGQYAFIGAGALVNKNVKPYALVLGVPSKQVGWISKHGVRLKLPLTGNDEAYCELSGEKYQLNGSVVKAVN